MLNLKYPSQVAKPGIRPPKARAPKRTPENKQEYFKNYDKEKRFRTFQDVWKRDHPWLLFTPKELDRSDERGGASASGPLKSSSGGFMQCSICLSAFGPTASSSTKDSLLRGQNTFINGCYNLRKSTILDHETSKSHISAKEIAAGKCVSLDPSAITQSQAGRALQKLKQADRTRLSYLVRNAHAVGKGNRPISAYRELNDLDRAKGVDIGHTYLGDKAALHFLEVIADHGLNKVRDLLDEAPFFSFVMDGSTDMIGDEYEVIYLRVGHMGNVIMKFLSIRRPESTTSADLYKHVKQVFEETRVDRLVAKDKLVGIGSDGASNMMGAKAGLATLLKADHPEVVSVHCLCHRLELAFRDVTKGVCKDVYTKMITTLSGLHTFYRRSYKNKKGLQRAWDALSMKGTSPPKVTGTRWLAHLSLGLSGVLDNFPAYQMHLETASHGNAKAEGLVKLLMNKGVMAFILLLKEVIDPLQRLSLKLQREQVTLADAQVWYQTTVDVLLLLKSSDIKDMVELHTLVEEGTFKGIKLRGKTPTLTYKDELIDGLIEAMDQRFKFHEGFVTSTMIANLQRWPPVNSQEIEAFGNKEVDILVDQFPNALVGAGLNVDDRGAILRDWRTLKCVLYKRYGKELSTTKWETIFCEFGKEFPTLMLVDLIHSLPATSVKCETTFSQMKLIKTAHRCRLRETTLNTLMTVKLESSSVSSFDPEPIIDRWLTVAEGHRRYRRVNYQRHAKASSVSESEDSSADSDEIREINNAMGGYSSCEDIVESQLLAYSHSVESESDD